MHKAPYIKLISLLTIALVIYACTEPFELETGNFSELLVINASITQENKTHQIFISRSYASDEEVQQVSGASVTIMSEGHPGIEFVESAPGVYQSESPFAPQPNTAYWLEVIDENGETFLSDATTLTAPSLIDEITPRRITNEQGEDGVQIYVDGTGLNDHSGYFRYGFEETYKIESFFNPQSELVIVSENPPTLEVRDKEEQEKVCYVNSTSNTIILAESGNLSENKVQNIPVQFLERRDRKVAKRYSILVNQYTLNATSYEFYETLKEFSSSDNLFSQSQPGLISGNMRHSSNPKIRTIGLFELVSVAKKRIFFDFRDIFGNDIPFLEQCESDAYSLNNPILFHRIKSGDYEFTGEDPPGFFRIARKECVDCTLLGSNVVPEFWIE